LKPDTGNLINKYFTTKDSGFPVQDAEFDPDLKSLSKMSFSEGIFKVHSFLK
jgi:hypothetical protein